MEQCYPLPVELKTWHTRIRVELEERGLLNEPVGVDAVELPVLFALQAEGIKVVDGQQLMQQARIIKTQDEITLLNSACMMVDAAYDALYRFMKPGVRENECVGLVSKVLYDLGSEHVKVSMLSLVSDAVPTHMSSVIGHYVQETRHILTFYIATTDIEPATIVLSL